MKTRYYSKIASDNIKKNPRLYIPRILAESGLLGCFYILITLALDNRLSNVLGGSYLPTFMTLGTVILGVLSLIIILYINSFLMKQRKNEYGLYNVLGMEKKHVIKVLFFESFYTSMISIIFGLFFGILFYKIASLLICKLLRSEIVAGFYYIKLSTVLIPPAIFAFFDLIAFAINGLTIIRLKPVDLLSGKHTGEKEPKVKWLLLIFGFLTLGAGYYIALTTKSPLMVIFLLFAAVLLVIIGTYCLYISGTMFVLNCLKKNKNYYYNKRHMPVVSGLLFRMKHNAVGLASIAVLATGVLLLISTTVSLYSGVQDTMDANYPCQLYLDGSYEVDGKRMQISSDELYKTVKDAADEKSLEIADYETEKFLSVSYLMRNNELLTKTEVTGGWDTEDITVVLFITEQTYNDYNSKKITLQQKKFNLKKNEIAFCNISTTVDKIGSASGSLIINKNEYKVKELLSYFPVAGNYSNIVNVVGIVVSDDEVLNSIYLAQKESYGEYASEYSDRVGVKFADEDKASELGTQLNQAIFDRLEKSYPDNREIKLDAKWDKINDVLGMYGTFLFLGILLGFVCLFSTILIIYYKQISEGYDDRERFQIMQKIGMEQKEVKKTIGNQLVLQFFMPLITAGIHTAVAFPLMLKLLKILMLSNTTLFIVCTLITFAVFALIYVIIYLLTARTYYKIVH